MTTFYFIRHGRANYSYGDRHGFRGHGHDLAPLLPSTKWEVEEAAKDVRLKKAQLILSSPYTRALETAFIIAKETGLDIQIEPDLMEWQPDLTYQYATKKEMQAQYADFLKCKGQHPQNEVKVWEEKEHVKRRMQSVLEKYTNYSHVIVVAHKVLFQSICNCQDLQPAQIYSYTLER